MTKAAVKINLHCLSFLSFIQKSQIPTYHWSKTTESGEKISWWNKCFHYFMLATIIGTQIIATSFSQHNSSEFSPIMPEAFGEHLIRDQRPFLHTESLQILQIHSSMTVLLLFSSPHSFSVGFRSEDRDSNGKRFILCSVTHFCVYFDVCFGLLSWWKIQTRPIIRFLTEAVRFWFFICWYLIESMMPCIWTRCSGPLAEKQAHNIKDPAVYLTVDMGYFFIPVCTKLIWWVCCQKALFSVSSDNRSQCHLKFQSCLTTEFAGVCFWMREDNFSWNPPEQHVVI